MHLREINHRTDRPEHYARKLLGACVQDVNRASRLPIMWTLVVIPPEWEST